MALFVALLLGGAPGETRASDTVAPQDAPPRTHSNDPAIRLPIGDDVVRRLDFTWFESPPQNHFALFHTVIDAAPETRSLQPVEPSFRSRHARAPPALR